MLVQDEVISERSVRSSGVKFLHGKTCPPMFESLFLKKNEGKQSILLKNNVNYRLALQIKGQ
jgi:hypothetical protein